MIQWIKALLSPTETVKNIDDIEPEGHQHQKNNIENVSNKFLRIKPKGSDGGHNGLKNINLVLNTNQYTRFRFGISDEFKKGKQVDYVLGDWDDAEKTALPERLEISSEIIKSFGTAGLELTMTSFNGK